MQVRLYSLAGHLHSLESDYSERPLLVQRLPSKLSSLAWDHNQHVGPLQTLQLVTLVSDVPSCDIEVMVSFIDQCDLGTNRCNCGGAAPCWDAVRVRMCMHHYTLTCVLLMQDNESPPSTSSLCIVYVYPSTVFLFVLQWLHSLPAFAMQGVVTVGDYDGVVSQIHLESGHFIADLDDHGGQRSAVLHVCHKSSVVCKAH